MFCTEIKTKDNVKGALIFDDYAENVVTEATNWFKKQGLKGSDMLRSNLLNRDSQMSLGIIGFTDEGAYLISNY